MAQSDTGSLIKWGLLALVGWYVYENYFATPAAAAPSTPGTPIPPLITPPSSTTPPPVTPTVTPLPPVVNVSPLPVPPAPPQAGIHTLDALYQAMVSLAGGTSQSGVDGWGYYLNQALAANNMGAAPDPIPIFAASISGFNRGTPADNFTAAQYWAIMGPALKTQFGLSGLGMFAGLGALYGYGRGTY
jgi:hypothetical protein